MFGYMKNSSKNNLSIIQKFIELENTLLIMKGRKASTVQTIIWPWANASITSKVKGQEAHNILNNDLNGNNCDTFNIMVEEHF